MLRVIVRGKFPTGLNFIEDISVERRNFCLEVEPVFQAILKNDLKIYLNFFQLKVRSNIKI